MTRRSTFGVAGLGVFGSALVTLPAARAAVTSGDPQAQVGWVVGGGAAGTVLPGTAAVLAAAWLGAGLVAEDYRHGLGLSTYARLPRRGAGLLGKIVVAACIGLALAVVTRVAAFLTALGGFALAHTTAATGSVTPSYVMILPSIPELFFAMLGGVVGVLCAPLVRLRLLAVGATWGLCAAIAAVTPYSKSPYTQHVARLFARIGLPVAPSAVALPELALIGLAMAAIIVVRRRSID
ncbi:hypothetical protein KDL01_33985 [Actinospica durhamensis]|uniref:Uncharacterized protein n=1 Tax=Actinospica durhamensis TaxID=1508375 RepID=A0A941EV64_9ACTN|nr:hypothetical protein [Actinospica durhamensis]MBR7838330.1 hypothetical protein [Actinospica durhamensis]